MTTLADHRGLHETREGAAPSRSRRRRLPLWLLGLALLLGVVFAMRSALVPQPTPGPMAMAPPTVTVSTPLQRRLATWTTFTGQFSAVDHVDIRAQVSGYLTEIHFKDGQLVNKGDLLFVIDPRPYAIALQNAKAQVATAESTLGLAGKELARTTDLMKSQYASRETLDQRTQQQHAAEAALNGAQAAVQSAELNLGWTHIVAPISGRISSHRVSIGNLIAGGLAGGSPTLLTTVVSQDPIYLDFDMGEGDYLAYERFRHAAAKDERAVNRTVEFALDDETGWKHRGSLDFLDNELDRASGTIHARATVPNHDLFIAPGEFARLRVPTSSDAETLLVPDAALSTDQTRTLVMTVDKDNTVVPKSVQIGELVGDLRIIKGGLGRDDRVVINGLMRARPGSKVTPKAGTISAPADQG